MNSLQSTLLLALLLFVNTCANQHPENEIVLAEVGNHALSLNDARNAIPEHILQADSVNAFLKYRDEWVRKQLIIQEAYRLNIPNRAAVRKELQRLQDEFIVQIVQDFIIGEFEMDLSVTDEEARDYYQQNKDKFILDERYVQYRHLIARNRTDADNARNALLRGMNWETVANQYSLYAELKIRESERFWPISTAGGDIAMLNRYLQVIGPSEISPIYRAGNEYHFVQLIGEKPKGEHPDLDWLIAQIKRWLELEKRKRAFNTYVKNLYLQGQANNEIKIYNVLSQELNRTQ